MPLAGLVSETSRIPRARPSGYDAPGGYSEAGPSLLDHRSRGDHNSLPSMLLDSYQYQPSFNSAAGGYPSRGAQHRSGGAVDYGISGPHFGDFVGPTPLVRHSNFPGRLWDNGDRRGESGFEFGHRSSDLGPPPPFEFRSGARPAGGLFQAGHSPDYPVSIGESSRDELASSGPQLYPSSDGPPYSHNRGSSPYPSLSHHNQPSPPDRSLSYTFGVNPPPISSSAPSSVHPRFVFSHNLHDFAPPPYPTNRSYSLPDISQSSIGSRDGLETFSSQDQRPFKCDQCTHAFQRNHDLKRHRRIHLAVKPYACHSCNKRFTRKDALKRHFLVKQHTGSTQIEEEFDAIPVVRGVDSVVNLLRRASATSELSTGSSSSSTSAGHCSIPPYPSQIAVTHPPPPLYEERSVDLNYQSNPHSPYFSPEQRCSATNTEAAAVLFPLRHGHEGGDTMHSFFQ